MVGERITTEVGSIEVLHCMCGDEKCPACQRTTSTTCEGRRTHCPHCGEPLVPRPLNGGHVSGETAR